VWLEQGCGLSNPCNGADVFPNDGWVNFGDFSLFARFWGLCTDPTNPDCIHLPLSLYEPPNNAGHNISNLTTSAVFAGTGEARTTEIDLAIPGRGVNFAWTRTYRSRTGSNTSMGNGWDHSYNIFLEPSNGNLILHDGTGRRDIYYPQSNNTWIAQGYFRELTRQPDNSFILTFPDTGKWIFRSLDEPNAPGKISDII
ncbi:MAG: hypothetical protein GY869_06290, partial [Planctomycetes bacterium]|nr:hypothetical protein [Planctomycetota bacterium]